MNYSPAGFSGALPNNLYGGYSPSSYGSYGPYGSYGSPYYPYPAPYPPPPPIPDDDEYEYVSAVEVKGKYAYVAVSEDFGEDNCQYLWVVDVSNPESKTYISRTLSFTGLISS